MLPLRFLFLCIILGAALALNLCLGDVALSPAQVWAALSSHAGSAAANSGISEMIWQIRLPRLLIASLVGVGLAVAGYILQVLSRNYLADPYLTGTSSGAGLTVALAMVFGLDFSLLPLAAFAGGLAASFVVALLARSPAGLSVSKLILSGVALSAICGGLITLIMINSPNPALSQGLFFWLAGGISGRGWNELVPAALYSAAGVTAALLLSKPLRLLSLGAQPAAALGLDVTKAQCGLLFSAVLLCGSAVSLSGLVGFVGLISPYAARKLFGRDERLHLVTAAMLGAILVLFSDLAARTLAAGQELPLGTLLSLAGGPFFLWLVLRQKGEEF